VTAVEAAVRLGVVVPAPETKSLDAAHPAPSAAQAELGAANTRPDEGAGPTESVRHAARRESRDAGLPVPNDLDAIMARADAATPGPWSEPVTEALAVEVALHSHRRSTEMEKAVESPRISISVPMDAERIAALQDVLESWEATDFGFLARRTNAGEVLRGILRDAGAEE
jgi:hypothetical protein